MEQPKNFFYRVTKIENGVVILFFILIFITLFLQFFTRYVLNDSLGWTEEIARVLLICLTFVGAVVNARENSEISLEFASSRLPRKWSHRLDLYIIKPLTCFIYFWLAGLMAYYITKSKQYLSSVPFPKKYITALVAFALFLMGIHTLTQIIKTIRGKENNQ